MKEKKSHIIPFEIAEQMRKLRKQQKPMTFRKIARKFNVTIVTVCYHTNPNQKIRIKLYNAKRRKENRRNKNDRSIRKKKE